MIFRIFFVLAALVVIYLLFGLYAQYKIGHELENVPAGYSYAEAKDADITIVEFISYSCPACQNIHAVIIEAVRRDGRVRYIPRPTAFTDKESQTMTRLVYAAGEQDAFFPMHEQLIKKSQILDEAAIRELARITGLDADKLLHDMDSKSVKQRADHNSRLFSKINGTRVPHFILNRTILYTPKEKLPSVDDFLILFEEVRGRK